MIPKMKKILILSSILAIAFACGKSEPKAPEKPVSGGEKDKPTITIPSSVNKNPVIGQGGGKAEVTFTASDSWTASVINTRADDWVSVSPQSGGKGDGKITITAKENGTTDERSATIQIKCGTASQNIVLTQKQKDSFTASASKTEIGRDGGTFTIEVKANVDFTFNIDSGADWITHLSTKALKQSTITFSVAANDDTAARQGQITVKSSAGQEVFKVYQDGDVPAIILGTHNAEISATGGSISIEVKSNVSVNVSCNASWIREISSRAMSTNTYNFTVDANEEHEARTADIVFTNTENNLSETVNVKQDAAPDATDIRPGFFGAEGLEWEFSYATDQILTQYDYDDQKLFALINPKDNTIAAVSYEYGNFSSSSIGDRISIAIVQNINSSIPATIYKDYYITDVQSGIAGITVWIRPSIGASEYIVLTTY